MYATLGKLSAVMMILLVGAGYFPHAQLPSANMEMASFHQLGHSHAAISIGSCTEIADHFFSRNPCVRSGPRVAKTISHIYAASDLFQVAN